MMTKRSNHMPMLIEDARATNTTSDVACATRLNQKSCGTSTLQLTIVQ